MTVAMLSAVAFAVPEPDDPWPAQQMPHAQCDIDILQGMLVLWVGTTKECCTLLPECTVQGIQTLVIADGLS